MESGVMSVRLAVKFTVFLCLLLCCSLFLPRYSYSFPMAPTRKFLTCFKISFLLLPNRVGSTCAVPRVLLHAFLFICQHLPFPSNVFYFYFNKYFVKFSLCDPRQLITNVPFNHAINSTNSISPSASGASEAN